MYFVGAFHFITILAALMHVVVVLALGLGLGTSAAYALGVGLVSAWGHWRGNGETMNA